MNDNKFLINYLEFNNNISRVVSSLIEDGVLSTYDGDYLENHIFINFIDVVITLDKSNIKAFTEKVLADCVECISATGNIQCFRDIKWEDYLQCK